MNRLRRDVPCARRAGDARVSQLPQARLRSARGQGASRFVPDLLDQIAPGSTAAPGANDGRKMRSEGKLEREGFGSREDAKGAKETEWLRVFAPSRETLPGPKQTVWMTSIGKEADSILAVLASSQGPNQTPACPPKARRRRERNAGSGPATPDGASPPGPALSSEETVSTFAKSTADRRPQSPRG
jgi:hypothetical protein